jgi:hypothetical protein
VASESSPQTIAVASPAAGAQFSSNPSPNAPFSLVGATFTLATNATAGTRYPTLNVGALGVFTDVGQAASANTTYTFFPGATGAQIACPAGPFPAGTQISSAVGGMQAGDQLSAISLIIALGQQAVT